MKKFFKKIGGLISRHKILTIMCILTLIVIIILAWVFLGMFISGDSKYGNRLDGIEDVSVSSSEKNEIVSFLEDKEHVTEASVRIQGKIIYINIVYTKDTSLDKAKAIATETLALIEDEQKEYYDIGYFLTQEEVEGSEETGFVVTGSKNAKLESISWIKS